MKLNIQALTDALRQHVAPSVSSVFEAWALDHNSHDHVEDTETGRLLLYSALGRAVDELPELSAIHLWIEAEHIVLSAEDAAVHPGFHGIPFGLDEVMALPLVSGARGYFYTGTATRFGAIQIAERDDGFSVTVNLYISALGGDVLRAVAMQYGPAEAAPFMSIKSISGAALQEAGRSARAATQAACVAQPPLDTLFAAVPPSGALN